jgi:hypothetical protein
LSAHGLHYANIMRWSLCDDTRGWMRARGPCDVRVEILRYF